VVSAPYWVRLVRSGSTLTGYVSTTGTTWTLVGSDTISMAASVYVGLPVTAHDNTLVTTATLAGVSLNGGGTPPTTTTTVATTTTTSTTTSSTTSTSTTSSTSTTRSTTTTIPTTTTSSTSSTTMSTSTTSSSRTTSSAVTTSSTSTTSSSTTSTIPTTTTSSSTTSTTVASTWTEQDIGTVGIAGSSTLANGTFSVRGSGADIWGTADAFHFVYQQLSGDGQIVARVASVQNTDPWAKGGVMIRASLAAGSAHAMIVVTPGNGVAYQWRATTGGQTSNSVGPPAAAPYWVRLVRAGNVVTGSASADGSTWTSVGSATIPLGTTAYFGLAVTSHNNGAICLSTFDNVALGSTSSLPPPWLDGDVGVVGTPGAAGYSNGIFTITASGTDIWGTADQFHFVYRPLSGNGQITARVTGVPTTDPWAKAGVMIRETLTTGSTHGMMIVSRSNGAAFQWRASTGAATSSITGPAVTAPYWVRMVRNGSVVSGYTSADGATWTLVGSATIAMAANVNVGLAITSHNNQLVGSGTFDNVQ